MLEPTAAQPNDISLRDYLDLLRRRKAIVMQTFVVVVMVGIVVTFLTKPLYRTSSRILVEGRNNVLSTADSNNPLIGLMTADAGHDIPTQIEILQSPEVLEAAFRTAGVSPEGVKLDIKPVNGTDVIEITAESNNPKYAEQICRALPEVYKSYIGGGQRKGVKDTLGTSRNTLEDERTKLHKAEMAMQKFKDDNHITDLVNEKNSRISDAFNTAAQVKTLEANQAGEEARLSNISADRAKVPALLVTPTTTSNTARRQALEADILEIQGKIASDEVLMNEKHPLVKQLQEQLKAKQDALSALPEATTTTQTSPNITALSGFDNRISEVKAQIAATQKELDAARVRATDATLALKKYNDLERRQGELQRDIANHESLFAGAQRIVETLNLRDQSMPDTVRTLQQPYTAQQVAPKKLNNLLYSVIVGLILALCFALLQEFLDDRINSQDDARRLLGAPILGYVPLIENEGGRLLMQSRAGGSLLESYRVLRSNVQFATVDASVNSLLVTSTVPGEGKSLTAANLAVAMALDGRKVILVDADLRRPTVHKKFDTFQSPGVTDVLVGSTPLDEALRDTDVPGLRLLTCGPMPPNPAELLNSRAMHHLHDALRERADVVIFDSPPCLATADAQVLSATVDGVLYVIQFGESKKSAVRHAAEMLQQSHSKILGVVFNKIDLSSSANDSYYGYYRYYSYYSSSALPEGEKGKRRKGEEPNANILLKSGANGHDAKALAREREDAESEEV